MTKPIVVLEKLAFQGALNAVEIREMFTSEDGTPYIRCAARQIAQFGFVLSEYVGRPDAWKTLSLIEVDRIGAVTFSRILPDGWHYFAFPGLELL